MFGANIVGRKIIVPTKVDNGKCRELLILEQYFLNGTSHKQEVSSWTVYSCNICLHIQQSWSMPTLKKIFLILKEWFPASPDIKPTENWWPVIKRDVYKNSKQYSSKNHLWETTQTAAHNVKVKRKFYKRSIDEKLMEAIKCQRAHINMQNNYSGIWVIVLMKYVYMAHIFLISY